MWRQAASQYSDGGQAGLYQAVHGGQQGDLRTQRTDFRGKDHQLQHGRAEESDLTFNASYDSPLQQVTGVLRAVVARTPWPLAEPEPFVRVNAYRDSSIEYVVRVWCATGDYWTLYYDLLEQVKEAFDRNGIEMTYNHLNVHLMEQERSEP